ncbi:MAG: LptF/LptG family permease [Alphaproteobacteria bacterium]|nr:LptF/LptG family permease [Alphaproteobacteria bacterium]
MFTLIDRYILGYFFKSFAILSAGFVGVLFIGIFIDQYDTVSKIPFLNGVGLLTMQVPQFIQPILPLCILIATMMTFWTLIRQSELIPMRSTGQSVWRFLKPLSIASFTIGIFYITLINPLSVYLNKSAQEIRFTQGLSTTNPFSFSEKGFWLKEKGEKEIHVVHAGDVKQVKDTLLFEHPTVFLISHEHIFQARIEAEKGALKSGSLTFKNGWLFKPGEKNVVLENYTIPTRLTTNKIKESLSDETMLSFWALPKLIAFLDKTGFNTQKQKVLFGSLLFFPFFLMVFTLLGMAFSISRHVRHTRFFIRIAFGIATGFSVFFMNKIILSLTAGGAFPIFLGISGTSLIILFLSVSFLLHSEDG